MKNFKWMGLAVLVLSSSVQAASVKKESLMKMSMKVIASALALMSLLALNVVMAAESETESVGLILNPPKGLKEKFPMCDAYLQVEWIDREKRLGHTHYEARMLNDKGVLDSKKKSAWSLVNLEDSSPSYTLDIYTYKQQKRMDELFDLVKNGKPSRVPSHFAIEYKGDKKKPVVFYDTYAPVFTNYEKTVCIAYPDEKKAWIIETPNVKSKYSPEQIEVLRRNLNWPDVPRAHRALENLRVLDINFDGRDDYLSDVHSGNGRLVGFSSADGLQQPIESAMNFGYRVTSPVNDRMCQVQQYGDKLPLTTDGKAYFFPHCTLTDLTSKKPKE